MEVLEKELKETEETKKLTPKQEKFCQEYVLCLNKGKAYSIAYNYPYETDYNKSQASSLGCKLYGNVRVNARIKELVAEANKNCDLSLTFLIKEQLEALERMKKGKKEKKIDFEGNVVDTGEIEYDNKAINGALKNLADFTGLSKQVLEAKISGKQEVTINKVDMLAETLFNGDDS
jgi:phage terminase small subunit